MLGYISGFFQLLFFALLFTSRRGGMIMKTRISVDWKSHVLAVLILSVLMAVVFRFSFPFRASASESEKPPVQVVNPTPTPTPAPKPTPAKPIKKTVVKSPFSLLQFDTRQLSVKNPDVSVKWSSSNQKVCTVTDGGFVQAVGGGTCTISATKTNSAKNSIITYSWNVTVTPLQLNTTKLTLIRMRKGAQLSLNNSNATDSAVWSSSNNNIASVSGSGFVTPHATGTAVISAKWNNATRSCTVQVKNATPTTLTRFRDPRYLSNRGKVVLAGSSLLDHWEDPYTPFGSVAVINNSVPDSTFRNWNNWYKKLIVAYQPKALVLCLGTDDIGDGPDMSAERAADKMQKLIEKIHKKSKKTKIFYLSLPCYPKNSAAWETTRVYNRLMHDFCDEKKYMTYLPLTLKLTDEDEIPDETYYKGHQTYLSKAGYAVVEKVVVKKVRKAVR